MQFLQGLQQAYDKLMSELEDKTVTRPPTSKRRLHRTYRLIGSLIAGTAVAIGIGITVGNWPPSRPVPLEPGYLSIKSMPEGAIVLLKDRSFIGVTPTRVNLSPGKYQLLFKKNGYRDYEASIEVKPDLDIPMNVTLQKDNSGGAHLR